MDKVYVGMRSPTNGMNSSVFMAVDTLLLEILKRKLVSLTSKISPARGTSKIGAPIYLKDRQLKILLCRRDSQFECCMTIFAVVIFVNWH